MRTFHPLPFSCAFMRAYSVSRRNSPGSFCPPYDVSAAWDAATETNFRGIGAPHPKVAEPGRESDT